MSYPAFLKPEPASNEAGGSRVRSDLCPGACRLRDITELALAARQPARVAGMGWPLATALWPACAHRNQAHSSAVLVAALGILLITPWVQPEWWQLVFPTKHASAKKLPSCPALCQPLSEVLGLTKVVKPSRRHQNAGEEVLCFCLCYRPGQKVRAAPSFCHAGQLV